MVVQRTKRQHAVVRTLVLATAATLVLPLAGPLVDFVGSAPPTRSSVYAERVRRSGTARDKNDAVIEAKARLLDFLSDETLPREVLRLEGKSIRGQVDELIALLERLNVCGEPAYSKLLDGTWMVKYSGSYAPGLLSSPTRELALFLYGGGFSLGSALSSFVQGFWGQTLGLGLGAKTLRIESGQEVEATAELDIAGRKEVLSYTAELMPLSARRLSEDIRSLNFPGPLGKRDAPFELRRSILVTYLDEEVMIVRDESGVPEVLVRDFSQLAPTDASKLEDSTLSGVGSDPMTSDAS